MPAEKAPVSSVRPGNGASGASRVRLNLVLVVQQRSLYCVGEGSLNVNFGGYNDEEFPRLLAHMCKYSSA